MLKNNIYKRCLFDLFFYTATFRRMIADLKFKENYVPNRDHYELFHEAMLQAYDNRF